MNFKIILSILSVWFCSNIWGDVKSEGFELLFKSDFFHNKELNGWTDVHQKSPPNSEWYQVIDASDGESFLRTKEILFGISHPLKREILIDDSILEVKLTVTFRKPLPPKGWPVIIALSSSETTAQDAGGPFWKGKDSGIMVVGRHYNLQESNLISWQLEGERVLMHPFRKPFNFLEAGKWTEWRLVYKHQEKELLFFHDRNDEKPFLIQHNVNLSGSMLSSVWISAWETEFKSVSVYCLQK